MPLDQTSLTQIDLLVPGIKCGGCIAGIERCLTDLGGVHQARVNLSTKRARVMIDADAVDADALVAALSTNGYDARPFDSTMDQEDRADRTGRDLLLRMGVAGFAAMNVMLLSISVWSGAEAATRDLMHWVSALIALPAMAYAGTPFFRSAWEALRAGRLNMDVPISLAIGLSAISSLIETASSGHHAYFDAGIMLIFFLLIGRYLDHHTRASARSAAAELTALSSRTAMVVDADGARHLTPVGALSTGMEIEVAAGERIPADGTVTSGQSDVDRALITGESVPERVLAGTPVNAGMLNLTGPLRLCVTATGDRTLLAEIARMVDMAERARSTYDRLADRAARIYAPGVHLVAVVAFAAWLWLSGDWQVALGIATAVLIITCPCALALAVPTVHTVATGRLFRSGIFLKDGTELERLAQIDMVAFDKTGTLTDGAPRLIAGPSPDDPIWPLALALAEGSRHPFSRAIAAEGAQLGIAPAPVDDIAEIPGAGVEATINGQTARLGRPDWIEPGSTDAGVLLSDGKAARHLFQFSDTLRSDAAETVAGLHARGLSVALISGDHAPAVEAAGRAAGIETIAPRLTPADKVALLEGWKAEGRRVLMVGDGLNDGPALAAAHASISPASAADVSKAAAGLVFTGETLAPVLTAIDTARAARSRALESFGIAAVYNAIAVPLAVTGYVTPLIAAAAMSGSSILVVLNALRLGRKA